MMEEATLLAAGAGSMRRDFDRGFADPPAWTRDDGEGVLALRAGDQACAVPLSQVRGLYAGRRIVALPGRLPSYLGIACLRSGIVSVHSLGLLLGQPPGDARWLLLAAGAQPFALTFEAFDTYARLPRGAMTPAAGPGGAVAGTALIAGMRRDILSLPSIAETLSAKS